MAYSPPGASIAAVELLGGDEALPTGLLSHAVRDVPLTRATHADRLADFAVAFFVSAILLSIGVLMFVAVTIVMVHAFRWLF